MLMVHICNDLTRPYRYITARVHIFTQHKIIIFPIGKLELNNTDVYLYMRI